MVLHIMCVNRSSTLSRLAETCFCTHSPQLVFIGAQVSESASAHQRRRRQTDMSGQGLIGVSRPRSSDGLGVSLEAGVRDLVTLPELRRVVRGAPHAVEMPRSTPLFPGHCRDPTGQAPPHNAETRPPARIKDKGFPTFITTITS